MARGGLARGIVKGFIEEGIVALRHCNCRTGWITAAFGNIVLNNGRLKVKLRSKVVIIRAIVIHEESTIIDQHLTLLKSLVCLGAHIYRTHGEVGLVHDGGRAPYKHSTLLV